MKSIGFVESVERKGESLHAAAHSHHPWPDVTMAAQAQAWRDAARLLDRKWNHVFSEIVPKAQSHIARQLGLSNPASIAFGPNTHGFVLRILSCLPTARVPRILTTDSEFLSFARQIARLEEDGLVAVTRVPTMPFETFEARMIAAARDGDHDLVYFSQVFFDSGFAVRDVAAIVSAVGNPATFVAIDGYHGFMALPTDLSTIAERAFYVAGGYKYAMAGEGVCFLHCPPGYGPRPRDTGWYAGFTALDAAPQSVSYAADASRFLGATFDVSALYRFNAAQDWLLGEGHTVAAMLKHVREIESAFLEDIGRLKGPIETSMLVVPDAAMRGRFLAFRTPGAADITQTLAQKEITVDHRGDRLRIGFGIYHDIHDAWRLARALADI